MTSSHSAGAYKERAGGGAWSRCEAQPLLCKECSEDPPVGITWELVRRRLSSQAPDPVNQNLHLKKLPRGFICTLKLKKRCTKPGSANFLLRAWYARLFSRLHFWPLLPPPPLFLFLLLLLLLYKPSSWAHRPGSPPRHRAELWEGGVRARNQSK